MATKPTPAQLAARKTFADMARSGAFKRKSPSKKKAAPKRKANPFEDMDLPQQMSRKWVPNPATRMTAQSLGLRIASLVTEGYSFAQAEAITLNELPRKPNAATVKAATKHAREVLNFPDPLRVTKKGVVRRNPVASHVRPKADTSYRAGGHGSAAWQIRGVKANPSNTTLSRPSMFRVHKALKDGEPGALLGSFPTLAAAKEYASAYATAHKCPVGIVGKK